MGSVGDSYDNALAETINGLYKAEIIHRRGPWRSFRLEAVEFATLEWVNWFNNRRLLEPYCNIPPAEAEERHYAMLEQPAMAAWTQTKWPPTNPGRFRAQTRKRSLYRHVIGRRAGSPSTLERRRHQREPVALAFEKACEIDGDRNPSLKRVKLDSDWGQIWG